MGRLSETVYPNNTKETREYKDGRLSKVIKRDKTFKVYEYDAAGNRLKTTKTSVRDGISDNSIYEYGYDELYYLTEVKRNGDILRRYGYDSYGYRI